MELLDRASKWEAVKQRDKSGKKGSGLLGDDPEDDKDDKEADSGSE
jgi:hypothetical protein